MKNLLFYFFCTLCFIACSDQEKFTGRSNNHDTIMTAPVFFDSGYSDVNGIKMYYEIHGQGTPLVLIHGGGSTIAATFGRIIPELTRDFKVIAVELQNHGRTGNRIEPQTFEQDADDVAGLLKNISIDSAMIFGFSNGGTTALQIAIRHPALVKKLVLASACYKRSGMLPGFFEGMANVSIEQMPEQLKAAFLEVNNDSSKLMTMFEKDKERMLHFKDMTDAQLQSVTQPVLIINANHDVVTVEHALEMSHLLPKASLAIMPGVHGQYIGEITTIANNNDPVIALPLIKDFLQQGNK